MSEQTDRNRDNATPADEKAATVTADPETTAASDDPLAKKLPLPLKIFGVLLLLVGVAAVLAGIVVALSMVVVYLLSNEELPEEFAEVSFIVLMIIATIITFVQGLLTFQIGLGLLRNRRRHAAVMARAVMVMLIVSLLLSVIMAGISVNLLPSLVSIGVLILFQSYLDPTLAQERKLNRKLRRLDERSAEEARLDHLRRSRGREPYDLNFFNIFWTFVVCSVLGVIIETIYYFVVAHGYMDRAGLLFGPFSPIYGFGAVLMTFALNRLRDKNIVLLFLVSAVIGGAFEYLVSVFLQYAFGITAWDYSGTFLSINGRTNGFYMLCWGILGVVWVKLLMPAIFRLIYLIPWDWRYAVTGVALALMLVDGTMTLQSLNCWFERESGKPVESDVQVFYATYFDDEYMANRFQTMTMNPDSATRVDRNGATMSPGLNWAALTTSTTKTSAEATEAETTEAEAAE